ncbi:EGF domain protein [Trichostrongylus colubriformis]|uniref:EGF domain protein n=1 Tax=Trichostrongylus colubriformis TaxID=6319 RepID=A0AAN8FHR5_TRICO
MRSTLVLSAAAVIVAYVSAERPKLKDSTGAFLVKISDIPVGSCGSDSYFGLGMMNGSLEECERWQLTDPASVREYEEYKCKHLRVHARMHHGKCVCEPKWKGPICNEFEGCPEGHALHGKVYHGMAATVNDWLVGGRPNMAKTSDFAIKWITVCAPRISKTTNVSARKATVEKCAKRGVKKANSHVRQAAFSRPPYYSLQPCFDSRALSVVWQFSSLSPYDGPALVF